jgi:hypothetical protein
MAGTHAFGTTFSWGGTVIGSINNINGLSVKVETVEVTTHDSTDAYKEYEFVVVDWPSRTPFAGLRFVAPF